MAAPLSFIDRFTQALGSAIGLNGTQPRRRTAGFDIEEFKSVIGQRGILPTNLFLVTISSPSLGVENLMRNQRLDNRALTFFCHRTDLPGVMLATETNQPLGVGPIERYPHNALFGDLELEFIGDSNGRILSFFHNWFNQIVKYNSDKVYDNFYKVGYKDSYECTIQIDVYNQFSNKVLQYKLINAFPFRLNQTQMEWSPSNEFMKIGVGFHYKTWYTDQLTPEAYGDQATGLSTVQQLIKAGTIAQTIAALKKPQSIGDIINVINNANIISGGLSDFF